MNIGIFTKNAPTMARYIIAVRGGSGNTNINTKFNVPIESFSQKTRSRRGKDAAKV
jgi:hypothetical protein